MKSNFSELTKKFDALALEKTKLAEELKQKDEKLKASDLKLDEQEGTIAALQDDLNDLSEDSSILNTDLLRKDFSPCTPLQFTLPVGIFNFLTFLATADPLGFELFTDERSEKETFELAGARATELIDACRNTCKAIGIKKSEKCSVPKLLKHMKEAPLFILDKQRSSARGSARTALALIHAHHPEIDLEYCTARAPEGCDSDAVFAQVQGLENRIVRMVNHGIYYDHQKLTPVNLAKQKARLRKEEAAHRMEEGEEEEGAEQPAEEAENSEERSGEDPSDNEDARTTASSPDQTSLQGSDMQED